MKPIRLLFLSALLICAGAATSNAQCPPEQDCEWIDDDVSGGSNCSDWSCSSGTLRQVEVHPSTGMIIRAKYCGVCIKWCIDENSGVEGPIAQERCWWVNYYASSYDPSKDIESLAFTDLIAVMEDLTRRAQITTRI